MSATPDLTAELRKEVLALEDDLRSRVAALPEVSAQWRSEYDAARAAERTAASWDEWRDERVTLAAVAWVLITVFVRFCEDNGLVKPIWITHAGGRSREATDAQAHFLREAARTNPDVTDREWLLEAVRYFASLPATAGLVDETLPMWLVSPSGDAATRILSFWRERNDDGLLVRELSDPELDTRFLGDLYQDISEAARKRYALLQTPVFVEEFILDRTLEPALAERPLEGFKAIDPTCGSGHFLLGIFARVLDRWHANAPGMDERERVQHALDAVHGVDLNPYAVAVARFRLTVAALQACAMTRLEDAPAFKYHLAAGDSLLHGLDQEEFELGSDLSADRVAANFTYATENMAELKRILRSGQYDCVVGNPPYIVVKDPSLNELYRRTYRHCRGTYALTVPFMERFFSLAKSGSASGWIGKITSNSFMKRGFGLPLVEEFFPTRDLKYVIDSEGVWMPGHNMDGTPTVILIGRNQRPVTQKIRAVLGKSLRENPASVEGSGPYWSDIVNHLDDYSFDSDWVSVVDLDRQILAKHPWSLTGGAARSLKEVIDRTPRTVRTLLAMPAGLAIRSGSDDAFEEPGPYWRRRVADYLRPFIVGTSVRDWCVFEDLKVIYPYAAEGPGSTVLQQSLWPLRRVLEQRSTFQGTMADAGLHWTEYQQHTASAYATPDTIVVANISSHVEAGVHTQPGVFKETLIAMKLKDFDSAPGLLGVMNSSAACFWLKQVAKAKGGAAGRPWSRTYQFNGGNLQSLPLPAALPTENGQSLVAFAGQLLSASPSFRNATTPEPSDLVMKRARQDLLRRQMVTQQEELDWEVYRLYELVDENLTYSGDNLPELALGERAFEIVLARKLEAGEEDTGWFEHHGSTPITELPSHWPANYKRLVERRIELVNSHPYLSLLEKPEHKRRWASEPWEKQEERSLRCWLLDRLENESFWIDAHSRPTPKSVAALADEVARDTELVDVLALWEGRPDVPVVDSLTKLLTNEGVPYLAADRYTESGLRKRAAWEHTWDLQRREDAGTYSPSSRDRGGDGPIPVPPRYAVGDFTRTEYWSHRGKLDVPKERFIFYPNAGRETDPTSVLGWAGWDHAQQALALAVLIQDRQDLDGWSDEQLVPLVAGLAEVLPWVEQWHSEPSDLYGGVSPAEFFGQQLEERMTQVSATRDTLQEWRPTPPTRGRKKRA